MKSVTRVYEINKGSTIPFGRNQFYILVYSSLSILLSMTSI